MNHKYRTSQVSNSKDKMDQGNQSTPDYNYGKETFIELVVGFVIFATHLFMNQTDALVPQFFYLYNIPVHNLGIFLSKLFSSRSISMILGSLIQYAIVVNFPSQMVNYNFLASGLLFSMRMLNIFFVYSNMSLMKMYALFNFDAFCTGFFLVSFLAMVTKFMPIVLLSASFSVSFAFFLQRPINYLYRRRPLVMFKLHGWISLAISCLYLGASVYYVCFEHRFPPSFKVIIDRIKSSVDRFELIMTDIKSNPNYVYFYVSLLKTLEHDVSSLFWDVKKFNSLKGITKEVEIMDSILKELKDKVKEILYYIDFSNQLRDKSLYDLKVPVRTKSYQHLTRLKMIKNNWDKMKAHLDGAKHIFIFKFSSPINYDYSEQDKPKIATTPAKPLNTTGQEPKLSGTKGGLMPPESSSFDLKTTPEPTSEAYSGESGSAHDYELSGVGPTEVELQGSGSGIGPTEQATGTQGAPSNVKGTTAEGTTATSAWTEATSDIATTTKVTTTTGTTTGTTAEATTGKATSEPTSAIATTTKVTTTAGATTAKSTKGTESTVTVAETAITDIALPLVATESITAGSQLPSTASELSTTATERSSIPTDRASTSGPRGTSAVSPESGSTKAARTSKPSTTALKPKSTKPRRQPVFVLPTFETDSLDLRLDRTLIVLGFLADSIIATYNLIKSSDGAKEEDKAKCLQSIYDSEAKVIEMDSKVNQIYRAVSDSLRYEQNVIFNTLKHIHIVHKKDVVKLLETKQEMKSIFAKNKSEAVSPLLMFFVATLVKDFLFPSILPFTFMQLDRNDMILLAGVIELYGSILVMIMERLGFEFRTWNDAYNAFWIMIGPPAVIFVGAILALNTNFLRIRAFFSSESKVLLMTVSVMVFCTILKRMSYVGVANYVHYQSGDVVGNLPFFLLYHIGAITFHFFVSKLAIKTEAKVKLGFRFPNLPIQQNPGRSCLLLWLRAGFKSSFKELFADIVTNLWRYL